MEMIIGCIFLGVILVILLIFCKNITINVNISQPAPQFYEIPDSFDKNGDPKEPDTRATIDDVLTEVNKIMLGREDNSNE